MIYNLPLIVRVKIVIVINDNNQVVVNDLIEEILYCEFVI
jgi:hypothetical protein